MNEYAKDRKRMNDSLVRAERISHLVRALSLAIEVSGVDSPKTNKLRKEFDELIKDD